MTSIDFLAGFTIFILGLIVVAAMVPGLLIGIQSSEIDYDAVAYRTAVILVEDPGWPLYPQSWELYGSSHAHEVVRMGLAVSKDTPNILLSTKVDRFFNETIFSPEDYREKVIFGDYPYSYNITLNYLSLGEQNRSIGDPRPDGYGYIRRVVLIKEPSWTEINETHVDDAGDLRLLKVRLNFSELLDLSMKPAYRIDPRIEPVTITITDFNKYLIDASEPATLKDVRFYRGDTLIPFGYNQVDPEKYQFTIDDESNLTLETHEVSQNISLILQPGALPLDENSILNVVFNFTEEGAQKTKINGTHIYDYGNATRPDLVPAVLEVAIW
ncbi:MAG: hypothetical protein KO206_08350 [Methanomicrobiaceae archaeon]|uniref:Uncharacterized protein n=1 Tax=hydrocarbon metagenome TaxID=938273 RepID=A0A0W8FIP2_9ZZZZ|nr:hypothetical protein [Methanomicrobiaceae archaeon]MDD5418234.1 hypothetical protein [Methanomicrobiaceae archaeon]